MSSPKLYAHDIRQDGRMVATVTASEAWRWLRRQARGAR
jgi:hypothetical protein